MPQGAVSPRQVEGASRKIFELVKEKGQHLEFLWVKNSISRHNIITIFLV